jgi:hypothetical protein
VKVGDLVRFKPNLYYPTNTEWNATEWLVGLLVEKKLSHCVVMASDGQLHKILPRHVEKAGKRDFQKGAKNEQQD